jgi:beta-phosphoglucomutase-like phosphatase (HAD superfamily)
MSIATSSPRESYDKKMAYFPFIHDSMKVICTGNEIKNGKPDPDIFLLASHRMNIDPSKCIVFEDSPNGVLAAKSAGCFCVAIPDKRLPSNVAEKIKRAGADMILNSLNEFNFDLFEFK